MLPKNSFAMVQTGVRSLEPRDIPIPEIDENSAILELEACGICGSDYEQYEGALPVGAATLSTITTSTAGDSSMRRMG